MDCIFCKIVKKEIPADIVLEDNEMMAFKDIRPKAPVHLLIIPKKHIGPINELDSENSAIIGQLTLKAKEAAEKMGVSENGYRLVFNVGKDAGMEVDHLHMHLLAGKLLPF
ncbi:MAG: histidine triad nucleotide-binding protein [Parcubacteria group bacterium]|nr:histidine triad nucleotide-binding protein [Parcubacteria group bacterium]